MSVFDLLEMPKIIPGFGAGLKPVAKCRLGPVVCTSDLQNSQFLENLGKTESSKRKLAYFIAQTLKNAKNNPRFGAGLKPVAKCRLGPVVLHLGFTKLTVFGKLGKDRKFEAQTRILHRGNFEDSKFLLSYAFLLASDIVNL